jgi:hypothetical protein
MSNYILSNNQTFSDIFTPIGSETRGNITSDSVGSTGINMSVIAGDTNPFTIQQTTNDNITFQTGSTALINFRPNNVSHMSIGSTGIFLNPNNQNNIVMYNSYTTCFKQFNYGAIDISRNFTLLPYHPRNVFVYNALTLTFPTTPPAGTFFRVMKLPVTATTANTQFSITLDGGTFTLYRYNNNDALYSVVTEVPATIFATYEFIYISELNRWQISSY